MPPGSGPMSSSLSSVGGRSGESCRFAGASIRPSGMPRPLDHERPFHAQFPAVDRAAARASPAPRGLGDAPVYGDFFQDQADDAVIGVLRDPPEPAEDPGLDPLVAAFPDRGGTAGAVGDRRI